MTFLRRAIKVVLVQGGESAKNSGVSPFTVELNSHRVEVVVQNAGGPAPAAGLSMRIHGMKLGDMNLFSTDGVNPISPRGDRVSVIAGDVDGKVQRIFDGTIASAYIDYTAAPEVSFNILARSAYFQKVRPAAPNSYEGAADVADIIESLAVAAGLTFENRRGVSVKLSNQCLEGSLIDQIHKAANAAGIAHAIENGVVSIWPASYSRTESVVVVGPNSGLIGFPAFSPNGIVVKSEFNPDIRYGWQVQVDTSVVKAKGVWNVISATHELATMTAGGSWFTTLQLTKQGLYAPAN